jgi:carbamoyltransferase
MRILGLSAFGGESAAALLVDGVPVAAAAEERFTRQRRDAGFPRCAIRACLREAGLGADELDAVAWHGKPLRAFERVLASQLRGFPGSARTFASSMFTWLGDRLWLKNRIATELGISDERVLFVDHHRAHAASAFLASPFDEAAVLVVDGAGEWATTSLHHGRAGDLPPKMLPRFLPHNRGVSPSQMP